MKSDKNFRFELLKDGDVKTTYETLDPEYLLIERMIEQRVRRGLR